MRSGYLRCIGGASGDMLLGALVDAGLPLQSLIEEIARLPIDGYSIEAHGAQRGVINGTQVTVALDHQGKRAHSIQDFLDMVQASSLHPTVKHKASQVLQRLEAAEARVHGESP